MSNDTKARIKKAIPIETDFTVGEIVNEVFPDLVRSNSEGRIFNTGSSAVARVLRRMKGVLEVRHLTFWAEEHAKK